MTNNTAVEIMLMMEQLTSRDIATRFVEKMDSMIYGEITGVANQLILPPPVEPMPWRALPDVYGVKVPKVYPDGPPLPPRPPEPRLDLSDPKPITAAPVQARQLDL